MKALIGMGSNLGNRRQNLETAAQALKKISYGKIRFSTLYQNPALLPPHARPGWNLPFLNAVAELETEGSPHQLLQELQNIESQNGRDRTTKQEPWSPRRIDLDLLYFDDLEVQEKNLRLPHPGISERSFVTAPLRDLDPCRFLRLNRQVQHPLPQWMAIANLSPDSFSDGGDLSVAEDFEKFFDEVDENFIPIVDAGAESTRPGAKAIDPEVEWERLKSFLQTFVRRYEAQIFRPLLSVDTRHPSTARKAILHGADLINDVSGLESPEMLEVLKESNCQYVMMHNLGVPARTDLTLEESLDPLPVVEKWLEQKLHLLTQARIAPSRIVFDPGIGFGKTGEQSLHLLKNLRRFMVYPLRLAVGHSRKSFMKIFTSAAVKERDAENIGVSLLLAQKGVDMIRVHQASQHARSYLAQAHLYENPSN